MAKRSRGFPENFCNTPLITGLCIIEWYATQLGWKVNCMAQARPSFRLLGPVEVRVDDRPLDIGPARQRCVLTVLLVDANRSVSVDQLVERVWGESPLPARPSSAVRTYISLLRRALAIAGDATIVWRTDGYLISVDEQLVDLCAFRGLVDRARGATQDAPAAAFFEQALDLWRGEAFGRLDTPWLNSVRATLDMERQAAERELTDILLRNGRHSMLLPQLSDRAGRNPLDEYVAGQLMLALFRSERQADALLHYEQLRIRIAEELGTDPGRALQELYQRILADDAALAAPPAPQTAVRRAAPDPIAPDAAVPPPQQLPNGIAHFTGRARQLSTLTALAEGGDEAASTVAVIVGTAGVGKTALAVHWGRRAAASFPEGQLYVDLRGFDPTGTPARPAVVVRGFLDALGVSAAQIPEGLDARFALYRSLLVGRRMLVVLDNARDAEQVRALLPGAADCVVLVTSRNRLDSLVALEGARQITLEPFSPAEARGLLDRRLGPERVAAESEAVDELADLCARLPLALNIAAAHAAVYPRSALTELAEHLRERPGPLAALDAGDAAANVRAVFSWSYRALGPDAARMFRLLSLNPGPDIGAGTAASLAAADPEQALAALGELVAAHLLAEPVAGRYAFHDLLRGYAAELTRATDPEDERNAALYRLLDHYLHTAYAAAMLLYPGRDRIELDPVRPGTAPEQLADDQRAWDWLDAERPALLAAIDHAAQHGYDQHAHLLPWTLVTFLDRRGHWHDYVATQSIALAAAERLGDRPGQARVHRTLGRAHMRLGSYPEVHRHLRGALRLSQQLGDQVGEAYNHRIIAWAHEQQGRHREALSHVRQALELFRAADHRLGQAQTLNAVGWYHSLLGEHEAALVHCREALELHHEAGDEIDEAGVWDSLGHAHHHLGEHGEAVTCFGNALELFRKTGERYEQANTLTRLGETHRAAGDRAAARDAWLEALTILQGLEHPDVAQVEAKLSTLM